MNASVKTSETVLYWADRVVLGGRQTAGPLVSPENDRNRIGPGSFRGTQHEYYRNLGYTIRRVTIVETRVSEEVLGES